MARPKPPRIEPHEIPKRPDNELDLFLERLYFRTLNSTQHSEEGRLNQAWVAFETLGAIFPCLDAGLPHEEASKAYPFPAWRDETVEIPKAIARALVEGWNTYMDSETKTLGQAFGFEYVNRQGKPSMKATSEQIDKEKKLANLIEAQYRQIGDEEPRSLASVIGEVAQTHGISESTLERAYKSHREQIDRNIKDIPAARYVATEGATAAARRDWARREFAHSFMGIFYVTD